MKNAKKKGLMIAGIVAAVVLLMIGLLAIIGIHGVKKYHNTHTWATISLSGSTETEESDAFYQETEVLKGDTITFDDVACVVRKIDHEGNVQFDVKQGNLYNDQSVKITGGTLYKNQTMNCRTDHGTFRLEVISNRYQ